MPEITTPEQNHILAALASEAAERVFPHLELVPLQLGKVLYESGDAMRHVYFPTDSIVSLLYVMENGASAEISVVGNEGVIGVALFMGGESTPSRAVVQSAGSAYRLPGQKLKDEFNRHGSMRALMLRYTQSLITQMSQTAVCNRHHSIDQQLCRWLLLSLDRLPGNRLTMTQELIANMLWGTARGSDRRCGQAAEVGHHPLQPRHHHRDRPGPAGGAELRVLRGGQSGDGPTPARFAGPARENRPGPTQEGPQGSLAAGLAMPDVGEEPAKLFLDHTITFTGPGQKPIALQDGEVATAVRYEALIPQPSGGFGDAFTTHPEHVGHQLLGDDHFVGSSAVEGEQEPPTELLLDGMVPVADRGLAYLRHEGLGVAQ